MKQFAFLIVVLIFFSLCSCQNKKAEQSIPVFNLDSAKQSIEHQNAAFQAAFENSDSVGLGNLFTSDGKMMIPGGASVEGRAAITTLAAQFMKLNHYRLEVDRL